MGIHNLLMLKHWVEGEGVSPLPRFSRYILCSIYVGTAELYYLFRDGEGVRSTLYSTFGTIIDFKVGGLLNGLVRAY